VTTPQATLFETEMVVIDVGHKVVEDTGLQGVTQHNALAGKRLLGRIRPGQRPVAP
jgi:hypothetical protein